MEEQGGRKKLEEKEEKRGRGEGGRENSWSPNWPSSLSILFYLLVADDILMNMDII